MADPPRTPPPPPPRRPPSGAHAAVPAPIKPRATTGKLVAVGVRTQPVADALVALADLVAIPPDRSAQVRGVLLELAHTMAVAGQEQRDAVIREYGVAVRQAYWHAAREAEELTKSPDARPSVAGVMAHLAADADARMHALPERDVRAILRIFGLSTSD